MDGTTSRKYSLQDYFELEANSAERWEYRDGDVLCMSGGSVQHSLIIANISGELRQQLKGSTCRVHTESLRVRIARRRLYSHPDVTVICGAAALDPDDKRGETVINPRLIVEVLSPTTELYDRTKKFERYCRIESFQEYVLVSQLEARVETIRRLPDGGWRLEPINGLESAARLASLGIDLSLAEIYAGVIFPPMEPEVSD